LPRPSAAGLSPGGSAAASRAAIIVVAVGVAVALIGVLPVAAGLLAAPALTVICRPLQNRLASHLGPRGAALTILIGVWVVLVVPGAWLAALAIQQVPGAIHGVQNTVAELRVKPVLFPNAYLNTNIDTLVSRLGETSLGWISTTVGPALGTIAHGIVDLSIALLGLYFLLVAGDAPWLALRQRLPFSIEGSDQLRDVFVNVTRATLLGTLSSASLQGFSIGIGLRLVGNGAPAFWGIVAGFSTLVPVIGNAIVWVPAVIVQLVRHDFAGVGLMLVFGKLIPSLLDRIMKTTISRRVGNTHPMVTLLGALAGVRLVGAVGVLIGPTIIQTSLALIDLYDREYGLPWSNERVTTNATPPPDS
jgi:predicted PurR-regulated permease PerM